MGCCVTNDLSQELTLGEIEEYNKLNFEINQILINKNNINIDNSNVLLSLINNISIKIANCEEIITKIKTKRLNSKIFNDIFDVLKNHINRLNKYSIFLNSQIIRNRKELIRKENLSLKESASKTLITFNESLVLSSNEKRSLNGFVYKKKLINRCIKSDTPCQNDNIYIKL